MGAVLPWGVGQGPERPVGPTGPWIAALPRARVCMVSRSDICLCLDHQQLLDSLAQPRLAPLCVLWHGYYLGKTQAATL